MIVFLILTSLSVSFVNLPDTFHGLFFFSFFIFLPVEGTFQLYSIEKCHM